MLKYLRQTAATCAACLVVFVEPVLCFPFITPPTWLRCSMGRNCYQELCTCALLMLWSCVASAARPSTGDHMQMRPASSSQAGLPERAWIQVDTATGNLAVFRGEPSGPAAAWAEYTPQHTTKSNFGKLRLDTSGQSADDLQLRAAGFLEGYLTAVPIFQHWSNMQWYLKTNSNHTNLVIEWLARQQQWMQEQIHAHAHGDDPFWAVQSYIWQQAQGIVDGYNARLAEEPSLTTTLKSLTLADIMLLNTFGDMDDLLVMAEQSWFQNHTHGCHDALSAAKQQGSTPRLDPRWKDLSPGQIRARRAKSGHCSALIKVTSSLDDILMGHSTWWSYASLLRIYKHYNMALAHPAIKAQRLSFSSYPGLLTSVDDFFITSAGLVILETSNDVYNLNLYLLSTNQAALSWQRARAACMLSDDGATWAQYIQTSNSGTYNNQYMVVDLKRFVPKQELKPGLLTVIEMVPGGAYVVDATDHVERAYWPSYNIPYTPEVYDKMAYPDLQAMLRQRGTDFEPVAEGLSYQVSSRAKIFRRDAGKIDSLADLKRLLRSNGWSADHHVRDPYSPSPWEAICARGDLDPEDPDASGCYDAKVTSYGMALQMQAEAINGPAWQGEGAQNKFPAFNWHQWANVAHQGMIQDYRTVFELQQP